MLLIAQKDKEWKTSYHPCLPTTYSSTVSTHNNCFCFRCPPLLWIKMWTVLWPDSPSPLALFLYPALDALLWHSLLPWMKFFPAVGIPLLYYLWLDQGPPPLSILSELLQVSLYSKVHIPPLLLEQHDLISWSYVNVFMVSYGLSYYMID